jgi:hypothetical protein
MIRTNYKERRQILKIVNDAVQSIDKLLSAPSCDPIHECLRYLRAGFVDSVAAVCAHATGRCSGTSIRDYNSTHSRSSWNVVYSYTSQRYKMRGLWLSGREMIV